MFTFRRYNKVEGGKRKRAKHPKLIVDRKDNEYGFMGLTESPKRGNHKNIEIRNPQKDKSGKSYIRNELRYDDKKHFSSSLKDYKLHKEDYDVILDKVNKHKKSSLLAIVKNYHRSTLGFIICLQFKKVKKKR